MKFRFPLFLYRRYVNWRLSRGMKRCKNLYEAIDVEIHWFRKLKSYGWNFQLWVTAPQNDRDKVLSYIKKLDPDITVVFTPEKPSYRI